MFNSKCVNIPDFIELISDKFSIEVVLDIGLTERLITDFVLFKPGLALAGYYDSIHSGRAMLFGKAEIGYLSTIPSEQAFDTLLRLFRLNATCIIVTKSLDIPDVLTQTALIAKVPILRTNETSRNTNYYAASILEEHLSNREYVHGVLMDISGMGVLITGKSGIGKSECAAELIKRGHRLVADDIVIAYESQGRLLGTSDELLRYHLELRGLGIINVCDMFGVTAIRIKKRIEFAIDFVEGVSSNSDRLGMQDSFTEILGHKVPKTTCEILPGRNMAVIVEIAARNKLLKKMGFDSSQEFIRMADERIKEYS